MRKFLVASLALAFVADALASSVTSTFTPVGSVTFTNKNSIDAQGDVDNNVDSWIAAGGGSVNGIRVTASLTEVNTATFASEARVRISPGAGNTFTAFNFQATTVGGFTGTLAIGPTFLPVTPFTLNAGGVGFEWFESFQDGTAGLPESRWDSVTYEFGTGSTTITNGGINLGALPDNGTPVNYSGSHVSGGLDFFPFSIGGVAGGLDYLNISTSAGAAPSMTDTEIAIYDSLGNLVVANDDNDVDFFSELSIGAADPLAAPNYTAGFDGLTLPAGSYTLVTGGFNTTFSPTIGGIVPGTNAGTYNLSLSYVPEPASLVLLALGGLLIRRR